MVVHFPIALLLTTVGVDLGALLAGRPGLHRIALWNLALGTLAALLAVWTGLRAAEVAKHTFEIHQIITLHERLGKITAILACMVVGVRLAKRDRLTSRVRAVTMLLALMMTATLVWGAHLGGRLVYEFGVGGRFGTSTSIPTTSHHH